MFCCHEVLSFGICNNSHYFNICAQNRHLNFVNTISCRLDAYIVLLKHYRASQAQNSTDDTEMQGDDYQTEVMKTVQKVISDIQRKYDAAARIRSNADTTKHNDNVLMDISTTDVEDNPQVVMSGQQALQNCTETFNPQMSIPIVHQTPQVSTSSNPLDVSIRAQQPDSPTTIQRPEVPIGTQRPDVPTGTQRPDLTIPTEQSHVPITTQCPPVQITGIQQDLASTSQGPYVPPRAEGAVVATTSASSASRKPRKIRKRIDRIREAQHTDVRISTP